MNSGAGLIPSLDTPNSSHRIRDLQRSLRPTGAIWARAVESIDEGAVALVVSHGGAIEPTLVACFPDADCESWGGLFGHCDGARLSFENGAFIDVQMRRAPH